MKRILKTSDQSLSLLTWASLEQAKAQCCDFQEFSEAWCYCGLQAALTPQYVHLQFSAFPFPAWHKANAIKTSTINFPLIHTNLSVQTKAGGLWGTPIYQDGPGVSGTQQSERWTAVGRKEMQPGWLGNTLIHCIRCFLTVAYAARASMEPLGETKTTLP